MNPHALVVGISKYDFENSDLKAPVPDALAFTSWLLTRGLPPMNIHLFLSPVDQAECQAQVRALHSDLKYAEARSAAIRAFFDRLPNGDTLLIYWSGHGVVDNARNRYLFYADASEALLSNHLAFKNTLDYLSNKGFRRQIGFFDVCAKLDTQDLGRNERPVTAGPAQQSFLLAASPGQAAVETGTRSDFTRQLLDVLEPQNLSFNVEHVLNEMQRRFTENKSQSPQFYVVKPFNNEEQIFGDVPRHLSARLCQDIERLHISCDIRDSIYAILSHPKYPEWMSISGRLMKNPVWQRVSNRARLQQMRDDYRVDGPTPPHIMHLDLFLMRRDDERGRGQIYTYFSNDWKTHLIPFRPWDTTDQLERRRELNVKQLARYLPLPVDSIDVAPLGKYTVSAKPHAKYGDLIIYVFEFCSVALSKVPTSEADQSWFYLEALRKDRTSSSVNGDVLRAVHELFSTDLSFLPHSLPGQGARG